MTIITFTCNACGGKNAVGLDDGKCKACSDYETGYRNRVAGSSTKIARAVADHWSGKNPLGKSDAWFNGYQDATDDLNWSARGIEQMKFGLPGARA